MWPARLFYGWRMVAAGFIVEVLIGALLFHAYADDLAARLPVFPGVRVLEVACGTGIVTRRLLRRLAGQGTLSPPTSTTR